MSHTEIRRTRSFVSLCEILRLLQILIYKEAKKKMSLINLKNASISFGTHPLLDSINMQISSGERVCLLGRNGEGKSTLMKVINGNIELDNGSITRKLDLKVGFLSQEVPKDLKDTVFEIIITGLGSQSKLLSEYHQISNKLITDSSEDLMVRLDKVQHLLEACGGWQTHQRVGNIIARMELDEEAEFQHLSAGVKRRVLLAKSIVLEPDILLLDEPTNHLDLVTIRWIEEFLLKYKGSLLFVTHDRMFLKKLATRIIELDSGKIYDWSCDYETFLQRKQAVMEADERQEELFDKKLAREEVWIRQGIKARRTRNEGRVTALEKMRETRRARRKSIGTANMKVQNAERSGAKVIVAKEISQVYNEKTAIKNFSTTIMRGDKVGLLGPNGIGKTTLLNIFLEKLKPTHGEITLGTKLQIAYFDQLRDQLVETESVRYNIADGYDTLTINGKSRHVIGYLQDFLFSPERAQSPVMKLSGGERNRLLLARLFAKPSNILVMDEPTNDLDIETLDLLEELLLDYKGTLLLVSHDRTFLNNVATTILSFEGNGIVKEYVGGYDDWLRQQESESDLQSQIQKKSKDTKKRPEKTIKPKKLSYNEKKELESLPPQIEKLEQEQKELHDIMSSPDFFRQDVNEMTVKKERLKAVDGELKSAYERWEVLEDILQSSL